jgi:pseudaminic acid cytidylyltransferase
MRSVAVIPARGGSRRIPRKNIRLFAGKPMIAWSVKAALDSGVFDEVIVSTDDLQIAEIARSLGAQVPFMRPLELSDDYVGITPVVRHAITWLREAGRAPQLVACVYSTAPFLQADDLQSACNQLHASADMDYVLAVCSFPSPVQRAITGGKEGGLEFLWPEFAQTRSQDLRQGFYDAGQFFAGRADAFMRYSSALEGRAMPYLIPRMRCQDIDTEEDWEHAESLFRYWQFRKECSYF